MTTFMVYYPGLDGDFVNWDDPTYVLDNPLVRDNISIPLTNSIAGEENEGSILGSVVSLNYHPLTILSLSWNDNNCEDCFYGISVYPYKLWNIILHILNALLVYLLVIRLTKSDQLVAFFVALIFAVHPMHVESVLWVSERKDVLYCFFFLVTCLSFIRYKNSKSWKWLVFSFIAFVFSCLSKAMAIIFPGLMVLLYYWFSDEKPQVKDFLGKKNAIKILSILPFVLISILFLLIAVDLQRGGNFHGMFLSVVDTKHAIGTVDWQNFWPNIQIGSYGLIQYFISFFYPLDLCTFYAYPPIEMFETNFFLSLSPYIVLVGLGLVFYSLRYTKVVFFGIGFFIIALILVLQFIPVGQVYMADRYSYMAYVGLAFSVVYGIRLIKSSFLQKIFMGIIAFYCIWLIFLTINQIKIWENSDTLWTRVIDVHTKDGIVSNKNIDFAYIQRANFYGQNAELFSRGQKDDLIKNNFLIKAVSDYQSAIDLGTTRAEAYEGLGNVLNLQNKPDQALISYSKALNLEPRRLNTLFNRGVTHLSLNQYKEAILDFTEVVRSSKTKLIPALVNRGYAYYQSENYNAAQKDFLLCIKYDPTNIFAKSYLEKIALKIKEVK